MPTSLPPQPARLLLVDDDPLITQTLTALFSFSGQDYKIKALNDPQQALVCLQEFKPEVIVSDFLMPAMNGITFLKQAKQQLPDASLILLTGYADKNSAIQAINEVGLFYFLEKPWDNPVLKLTVARAAEQARLRTGLASTSLALNQAHELSRLREDFVSTLTHDLRTPLIAAIQTLALLANGKLGSLEIRQSDIVHMLVDSQKDLLHMVNSLLEVYRFESGQHHLLFTGVNMVALINNVLKPLQVLMDEKKQELILTLPAGLPDITGDSFALHRVLTNLLANSIQHTPVNTCIHVGATVLDETMLEISIQDNGPGIPAKDVPLLFQRFSQGTSKLRKSGSGLGLYLARQIIEAHHGDIGVSSEEGKGCRFYICLPLKQSSVKETNLTQPEKGLYQSTL